MGRTFYKNDRSNAAGRPNQSPKQLMLEIGNLEPIKEN